MDLFHRVNGEIKENFWGNFTSPEMCDHYRYKNFRNEDLVFRVQHFIGENNNNFLVAMLDPHSIYLCFHKTFDTSFAALIAAHVERYFHPFFGVKIINQFFYDMYQSTPEKAIEKFFIEYGCEETVWDYHAIALRKKVTKPEY